MRGRPLAFRTAIAVAALPAALAACAATPGPQTRESAPPGDDILAVCDAASAQAMLGQKASAEIGQQLLRATGARLLRWAPPRSAMTMDYRTDRLTIEYDDALVITRISCG